MFHLQEQSWCQLTFPSLHQISSDYKRHLAVTGMVMSSKKSLISYCCFFLLACTLLPLSSLSQETAGSTQSTIEGTVASVTRQTFVVRTEDNQFYLFTFNRYTAKPQSIAVGARVRVESRPGAETGTRLATRVTTLEAAPSTQQRAAAPRRHLFQNRLETWRVTSGAKPGAGDSECGQEQHSILSCSCLGCIPKWPDFELPRLFSSER